jgi:hypothetical protein
MANYAIKRMQPQELQTALDWAEKEGWNPGLHDAKCYYQADPNGFFMGWLDGKPIAVGSAVIYSAHFAFCGLYIVKPEFRGQGYGLQLTQERLNYIGNRITGLDGVLDKVAIYEKLGYVVSHRQIRYELSGALPFHTDPNIVKLETIPFGQIANFDQHYFQSFRDSFLRCWTSQPESHALGYFSDKQLAGYGVIRKCAVGYKIGPLFATSEGIASSLFAALCCAAGSSPIYLDIPETNQKALKLVKDHQMVPKFEVIRMYRNGMPLINQSDDIYGVTSFELG